MKNFVQPGDRITVTAAAAATAGELVVVGSLIAVAFGDAEIGDQLTLAVGGVFDLPKVTATAIATGDPVYRRSSDGLLTGTASGNTKVGIAVADAANPSATVRVRLNPSF